MNSLKLIISVSVILWNPLIAVAENVSITLKSISEDQKITGTVTGLVGNIAKYCVVVYIHTDEWYIHPYTNGGPGKSWTAIDSTGNWEIETVKREFPADKIAIVVLSRSSASDCDAPAKVTALANVPHQVAGSPEVLDLRQRGFYGRL